MKFDINAILDKLKDSKHPLFVSERQLQSAFTFEAYKLYENYDYYPEYVFTKDGKDYHIDLLVCDGDKESVAIEFKYIVAGGTICVPGKEEYELREQSAINNRRYDCVKDVWRLEQYVESTDINCSRGYFILITNMPRMWIGPRGETADKDFDISGPKLKKGAHVANKKGKFAEKHPTINLNHNYEIKYKDYTKETEKCNEFKSLCIEVNPIELKK